MNEGFQGLGSRVGKDVLGAIVLGGIAIFLWSCQGDERIPSEEGGVASRTEQAKYVGRKICTQRHETESDLSAGSPHDLAMQEATAETVLGNFDGASFTHYGTTTSFFRRGDGFFAHADGPDGKLRDYEVKYTFGVTPLQQYLVELDNGRYQALSVTWDSRSAEEGGQRWFHLYPDEAIPHDDMLHWTGPYQNWNAMCADCHSTGLRKQFNLEQNTFDTEWAEMDVSCEACHGPGSRHVDWADAFADDASVKDNSNVKDDTNAKDDTKGLHVQLRDPVDVAWVMNPSTGIATRSTPKSSDVLGATCAPCHSRRSTLTEAPLPGGPFLDTHRLTLLEEIAYHSDGQIDDEVYVYGSFLQSKMYQAGVTCINCHEPHSLQLRAPGNTLCAQCHLPAKFDTPAHYFHESDSEGSQCVNCHMPAKTYMVVDPRRDHSLRVPRPDLSVKLGTPNACTQCHVDETAQWAVAAIDEWYDGKQRVDTHYGEILHAGRSGSPDAEISLSALARAADMSGIVRATALSLLSAYPTQSSVNTLQNALHEDDPLLRVAALESMSILPSQDRLSLILPLLDDPIKAVRLAAAQMLIPVPQRSMTSGQKDKLNKALGEYEAAQLANADRAEAHANLGMLYAARGQEAQAENAYQTAIRVNPTFVFAYINLADLYRTMGQDNIGEQILREALQEVPEAAAVHYVFGLLLARQQRLDEAIAALEKASALEPSNARYSYVHGIALNTSGNAGEALAVLDKAHRLNPFDRDLLQALATISRDQGVLDKAVQYARDLVALSPQDPSAQQLLDQLQAQRGQ